MKGIANIICAAFHLKCLIEMNGIVHNNYPYSAWFLDDKTSTCSLSICSFAKDDVTELSEGSLALDNFDQPPYHYKPYYL